MYRYSFGTGSRTVLTAFLVVAFLIAAFLSPRSVASAGEPGDEAGIVPDGAQLEELWEDGEFTEGVAVGPEGKIYFSDITRDDSPGKVMRFDPETNHTSVYCPNSGKSNGLMFDRMGRLIAACGANYGKQALCQITSSGKLKVIVDEYEGRKFNSPNDLVIHPDGSIYFSDPRYVGPEPVEIDHMSVYRYNPADGALQRVTFDIEKPNGVALSPDAKTLYVAETNNGTVKIDGATKSRRGRMTLNAFPIKPDGSLGKKTVLVDFSPELGTDGMTVDVQGHIYAAVRSASRHGIIVYSPKGRERAYIPTADLPTNCCFGIGKESTTLYVTAGTGLYRIRLKIDGFHPALAEPVRSAPTSPPAEAVNK